MIDRVYEDLAEQLSPRLVHYASRGTRLLPGTERTTGVGRK